MSALDTERPGKPGFVIFVAVVNFFWTALFFLLSLFMAMAIVFGVAWGMDRYVAQMMTQYSTTPNFSYGLAIFFGVASALFFTIACFFLVVGTGLVRGKPYAWYLQIAMSTLGLLGLPLTVTGLFVLPAGAILNIVILVLFFQNNIRRYFGI